jgi:hypothetical protein
MKSRALAVIALVALCASGAQAGLTTVNFSSEYSQHHLTQFDGVATYDSSTGKLAVAVINTTSAANGGFLTGIALSAKGPTMALETTGGFVDARNHKDVVNAGPLGKYTAGATTGGGLLKGMHPASGIAAGSSRVFTFETSAANADSLTVADFLTPGKTGQEIVARFKKLSHRGNDRGGAVMNGPVSDLFISQFDPVSETGLLPQNDNSPSAGPSAIVTTTAVPLPPALWMALITIATGVAAQRVYQLKHVC